MIDTSREETTQITAFVDASNFRIEHDTTAVVGAETPDGRSPDQDRDRTDMTASDSFDFVPIDPTLALDGSMPQQDEAALVCNYFPAGHTAEGTQIYGNLGPLGSGNVSGTPTMPNEDASSDMYIFEPLDVF